MAMQSSGDKMSPLAEASGLKSVWAEVYGIHLIELKISIRKILLLQLP